MGMGEKRKSRDFVAGNSRESELFEIGKKSLRLKVLHFAILRRGVIQVKIQLDDLKCCMPSFYT